METLEKVGRVMRMKLAPSLVIAMALVVSPLSANAEGKFMGWYVEGHLGMAALGAVSTSYSGSATLDGLTYDGKESLGTEYNRALAFGAEFGARDIGRSGVRLGLALTQFTPEIDSRTTTFSGKAPDNDTVVTVIRTGAHGDESEDTKVGLYGLNVYYDFDSGGLLPFSFTPFIGAGVGLADFEGAKNKERALSVHLGGQFSFPDSGAYVGLKGSYYHINGPVKNRPVDHYVVGLKYDDVGVFTALGTLGYRF